MQILNQITTGKPCPDLVEELKRRIENRDGESIMQYINVYAYTLAMVLDRLEYLERFEARVKKAIEDNIPYNSRDIK